MDNDKTALTTGMASAMGPKPTLRENLDRIFPHQPTSPEQFAQMENIREAAKDFAEVMFNNTPASADQSAALRKIREAVWTANAAIMHI